MTENLHSIFSGSECPSEEELRSYFDHRLPDEEKHRIEAHLADCEMCTDELEGLSLLSDPDKLPRIVRELEERTAARKIRSLPTMTKIVFASAAIILLLIGTLFIFRYILPGKEDPLVSTNQPQQKEQIQEELAVPGSDSPEAAAERIGGIPRQNRTEQDNNRAKISRQVKEWSSPDSGMKEPLPVVTEMVPEMPSMIGETESVAQLGLIATSHDPDPGQPTEIAERLGSTTDTFSGPVQFIDGIRATRQKASNQSDSRGGGLFQKMGPSLMNQAMERYEQSFFPEAAALFQEVISADPENYKAIYHLALCYYNMQRPKKALRILKWVLEDPDSTYYKEANRLRTTILENAPDGVE